MKHGRMIPEKALAQHLAIFGRTGSGKTYTAKGIVENLLDEKRRVCIIDPTGAWWGLKSSADGLKAGYPVVIFGGDHADSPLTENMGAALAELIASSNLPCIIDLSDFGIRERDRFAADFAETLLRLNRTPLHLIIDEADEFLPMLGGSAKQDVGRNTMLNRFDRIIRRGRRLGFRVMMISQRPAVLHTNARSQAATLIAMRLSAQQDRKAIEDWIKGQGDVEQGREVMATLARLDRGEGWVWFPEGGVLDRAHFPPIRTFDSSATPEDGETIPEPRTLAEVDLTAINTALAEATASAKANDPAELKKRISELERQLRSAENGKTVVDPALAEAAAMRAVADARRGILDSLMPFHENAEHSARIVAEAAAKLSDLAGSTATAASSFRTFLDGMRSTTPGIMTTPVRPSTKQVLPGVPRIESRQPKNGTRQNSSVVLSRMQRAFLTVLAQSVMPLTKQEILWHAQYQSNGQTSKAFTALEESGWMSLGQTPGAYVITEAGREALGDFVPLPTGDALREHILSSPEHSAMEKAFLRVLCGAYPNTMTKAEVLERAGYKSNGQTSGAFRRIAMRGWIVDNGRSVGASDLLFGR